MAVINNDSMESVKGTNDSDSIANNVDNATINALNGNDTINNAGDTITVVATGGINNLLDGGDGDDQIINRGKYVGDSYTLGKNYPDTLQVATMGADVQKKLNEF